MACMPCTARAKAPSYGHMAPALPAGLGQVLMRLRPAFRRQLSYVTPTVLEHADRLREVADEAVVLSVHKHRAILNATKGVDINDKLVSSTYELLRVFRVRPAAQGACRSRDSQTFAPP